VVVRNGTAVGQQLAVVVEQHDAVAQQPPPLLRMTGYDRGEVAGVAGSFGARSSVVTHGGLLSSAAGIRYRW
jgi:hypothetical protein